MSDYVPVPMETNIKIFTFGLVLILIGLTGMCDRPATAQELSAITPVLDDGGNQATVLALARVCFSERDSRINTNDCAAILQRHLTVKDRTHRPLLRIIQQYSPRATGYCRQHPSMRRCRVTMDRSRQRWISTLNLDLSEPDGWAEMNSARVERNLLRLAWNGSYREAWRLTLEQARELLRRPQRVCSDREVHHWGGRCENNPRGVCDEAPAHWIRLDCGETVNDFYHVPRVRRPDTTPGRIIPASVARGRS